MPLGLFKQRLCSRMTCESGVVKRSATQKVSVSKSGKRLQISEAVHRRGGGSSRHRSVQTQTCTASKIWPVQNADEVTRDEREETKVQKPRVWMNLLSKVTLLLSERCVKEKG